MKNDKLFRDSVIFADLVLFMILCYTAYLGAATTAGAAVIYAGTLLTAAVFVALVTSSLNWMEHGGRRPVHA